MADRTKGLLLTALGALLWSTAGLFIKLLPQDAFTILFYRSGYALLLFGLLFRGRVLRFNRQLFINVCFYLVLLISFVSATKLTTAANAIFLQYTGTAWILLLEPRLFKVPLLRVNLLTTIACFVGMFLFFVEDFDPNGGLGILLGIISGLALAGIFLGQRLNDPAYHMPAIFWGNLGVVLICLPAFLQSAPPSPSEHGMLAFLGFIQIGLGYVLVTYGLKFISAVESSLLAMLEPVLNPIWVLIGYGERPGIWAIVGGTLIVLALSLRLLLLEWYQRNKRRKLAKLK